MRWYKKIYTSDSVASKKNKILHKMKRGKLQIGVYAITLPVFGGGIMEIYPAYEFLKPYYKKADIVVVGLSASESEAYEIVTRIVSECYSETKGFDIAYYLNEKRGGISWR